ncbi:MAG: mevalonate kinase [Myxococcota bacterium]|jgi:hydroxymethylglutaryl-CoA reductase
MNTKDAFGKAILFGEHSAVYGRAALVAGIAGGMKLVSAAPRERGVSVRVGSWGMHESDSSQNDVGECIRILDRLVGGGTGAELEFDTAMPPSAGLGSSASLAVAVARAISAVRGFALSDGEAQALAHESEKVFHGTPSGLDDTAAAFGGVILFRRGGWGGLDGRYDHCARLTERAIKVSCPSQKIVIGHTGVTRSTRKMVGHVRSRREECRQKVESMFDEIEVCLETGVDALQQGDQRGLGKAMSRNHEVLRELGVSSPEVEEMLGIAASAGASGGKLTGAGGGGCVIVVAPGRETGVLDRWMARGYRGWITTVEGGC